MHPIRPKPVLIVDTWGFRLVDKDGNFIGKMGGYIVTDAGGTQTLHDEPGIIQTVQALPVET